MMGLKAWFGLVWFGLVWLSKYHLGNNYNLKNAK